jgi:hypothetical protein
MKGCSFHLNQAMFRHIKKMWLGLQYRKTNKQGLWAPAHSPWGGLWVRELMSLNLLPAEKIEKEPVLLEIV